MENVYNDFTGISDAGFATQQPDFYLQTIASSAPDDEDEDTKDDDDKTEGPTESDPPLDDEVVHSPLPPQTGGKPR